MTGIEEIIGGTPLLPLKNFCRACGLSANIFAKAEMFNPTGSTKARAAAFMVEDAERRGALQRGGTVIEPTSGNTGIALAAIGRARGYEVIITMPENMSEERRALMAAYGAQVVLTPKQMGMAGAIARANELKEERAGSIILGQFENPANPAAHEQTTAPEIWNALAGNIHFFVAGVGTGGTVTGAGRFLKRKNPSIKIIAVEPFDSPVLSGGKAGAHALQGIGAGFVPPVLDRDIIDEVIAMRTERAVRACRRLARSEGLLAGFSSGAALCAAVTVAGRAENAGKNIVVVLPDGGERYLSSGLF